MRSYLIVPHATERQPRPLACEEEEANAHEDSVYLPLAEMSQKQFLKNTDGGKKVSTHFLEIFVLARPMEATFQKRQSASNCV
jgi:hypothetical protein